MLTPVIMAGGSGTRLWPLSRASHPKQFLSLHGEKTMLQQTVERLQELPIDSPVIICNEEHRFFVAEQLREINRSGSIILEPVGRNTAPAIALAALTHEDEDPLLLILAADHVITDVDAFTESIKAATPLAEQGKLVAFGIIPSEPHIGYGYIKAGKAKGVGFMIDSFTEKPDAKTAEEYLSAGGYYWNSGMFLFRASRYLEELKSYRPDILNVCTKAIANAVADLDFIRVDPGVFAACPDDSIDYAVMENTSDAVVVPMDAGWDDVGSWSSLWDLSEKDSDGNALSGDVVLSNSENCYVRADGNFGAVIGVNNLIVVSTKDAFMVTHRDSVQEITGIVSQLKDSRRSEWNTNREVYRPWGKYDSIDSDVGYQVKKLTVNPGAKLSVQMHHHRSEHWIVVSGTATVHYENESFELNVNESTFHGKEVVHALENSTELPLELIEVQVGDYLGEDDIVRFEDIYGRR